jgi:O-antigen/teichoic acid export membrane protein
MKADLTSADRADGQRAGFGLSTNILFMALTTGARLLTNVVLFVLLARAWPVAQFGGFVYWFTATAIIVVIVDFGFSQSILRDIGRDQNRAGDYIRAISMAKLMLAGIVLAVASTAFALGNWDHQSVWLFFLLLIGGIFASLAESLNATYRGIGEFGQETRIVVLSSLLLFGVVLALLMLDAEPLAVAAGMLVTRGAYLMMSSSVLAAVPSTTPFKPSLHDTFSLIARYRHFGFDAFLTNLYSNVDTILVGQILGAGAVGVYQAGMRLMQGANTFAPVLANVYLAPMARAHDHRDQLISLSQTLYALMLLAGALGALVFIYFPAPLIQFLYGERYSELASLMPWFGILLLVRYLAAAHGVALAALGHQATRACAIVACLGILAALAVPLLRSSGALGMALALLASTLVLHGLYLYRLVRERMPLGLGVRNTLLTVLLLGVVVAGMIVGR